MHDMHAFRAHASHDPRHVPVEMIDVRVSVVMEKYRVTEPPRRINNQAGHKQPAFIVRGNVLARAFRMRL